MTDRQNDAKKWLKKLGDYSRRVDVERRTLEMLQHRLYKGVANYENGPGQHDAEIARAAYEDSMIECSVQADRVEGAQLAYTSELENVRRVLECLPVYLYSIAVDRYINGIKWEQIEDIHRYSKSTVARYNLDILDHVADYLERHPEQIQQAAAV